MARVDFNSRTIFLSVRELAQFQTDLTPQIDIEHTYFSLHAMELGRKWHTILQNEFKKEADKENDLFCVTELFLSKKLKDYNGWKVIFRGRLDVLLVDFRKKLQQLIEIKTSGAPIFSNVDNHYFDFQIKSYQWLFERLSANERNFLFKDASNGNREKPFSLAKFQVNPKIILVNTHNGEKDFLDIDYNDEEFSKSLEMTKKRILDFFTHRINHVERFRLVDQIPWFFEEFRKGQQENIQEVKKAFQTQPIVMEIGPPGSGKTAINLRILLERAIELDKQIFCSTTKTSQQIEVVNIVKKLNVQLNERLWTVSLIAKEKFCINHEMTLCQPFLCHYFKAMRSSLPNYQQIFDQHPVVTVDLLKDIAVSTQEFCPYYKSKFLAGYADIVIGDQNFIFSPDVKIGILTRPGHPLLFSKTGLPYLYLLDEAHNLPSRIRDELSLVLELKRVEDLKKIVKKTLEPVLGEKILQLIKTIDYLIFFLSSFSKYPLPKSNTTISALDLLEHPDLVKSQTFNHFQMKSEDEEFFPVQITIDHKNSFKDLINQLSSILLLIEEELFEFEPQNQYIFDLVQEIQNLITLLNKFYISMDEQEAGEIHFFYHKVNNTLNLETFVLNIANFINQELKGTKGSVFMSATLHPEYFYRAMFGFKPEIQYVQLNNHFPRKNRKTLVVNDIQTRYAVINQLETLRSICLVIKDIWQSKKGKYLLFTPNLKLIESIFKMLKKFAPNIELYQQNQDINFNALQFGVIICSLGSIFSEGVNLSHLSGVIIISPGIPPPSYKNSLLMNYYGNKTSATMNKSKEEGFNLTFKIPGFNKILQAAGRLHRHPDDRGIIILLGERFATKQYENLFPSFLQPLKIISSTKVRSEVKEFWK